MPRVDVSARLYEAQQADLELDRLRAEQQALQTALASDSAVREAQAALDDATVTAQAAEQQLQAAEAALVETTTRLELQEQRLYGSQTNIPRDLRALQQEVAHLREQQGIQEEHVLLGMDKLDQAQAALAHARAAWDGASAAWERERAELALRLSRIEERTAELQEQRRQILAACDLAAAQRYETLRRTKQGKAVSRVVSGTCQWCRVMLTSSEMQRLRQGAALQVCGNCGRILYLEGRG
jgi:predicted  nucleic acid-binding Zn-ribbon protein